MQNSFIPLGPGFATQPLSLYLIISPSLPFVEEYHVDVSMPCFPGMVFVSHHSTTHWSARAGRAEAGGC